ncbi:hypothetical protein KTC96_14260 [Clostridium estertheticum]|uniref:hypothetical protein n=1 Tax=Clostridium estertheticum TaxID=238834 RepID=UPI001C7D5818|nr:hypothetical protein [Clostridium estertheticum]MBX4258841.1 hypothetical protein [Clostridium estertheticum]WLC69153.1 hypothetical protein KTC96_14260 [Clostridium estertheticum]
MKLEDRKKFVAGKRVRIKGTDKVGYIDYAKIINPSNDSLQVYIDFDPSDEKSNRHWAKFDDLELLD